MIQSQELRLGNLLLQYGQEEVLVHKIGTESVNDRPLAEFSPIPLTTEWLEKFGFDKKFDSYWKGAYSNGNSWDFIIQNEIGGVFVFKFTKIQYVHELQNLFFCLTGEELEVK